MPPSFLAFVLPFVLFLTFWTLCYTPLAGLARAVTTGMKSGAAWVARSRVGKWAVRHSGPIGPYASILLVMAFGAIAAPGARPDAARLTATPVAGMRPSRERLAVGAPASSARL
jgi:hypothetical protein